MFSLHIAINNPLFTSRLIYTLTQLFINNPVDIPIFSTYFAPLGFCQYDPVEISYLLRRFPAGDLTTLRVDGFGFVSKSPLIFFGNPAVFKYP
jgi:hypothetical protein